MSTANGHYHGKRVNGSSGPSNYRNERNNKKIEEVKEVIQNRPNAEILKVLDHFNNDVGKTISAFVEDQVKDILSKSGKNQSPSLSNNSKRSNSRNKSRNNRASNDNSNGKGESNNKTRPQSAFKLKIDDLVDSVINKYTGGNAVSQSSTYSFINPIKVVSSSQSDADIIKRLLPTPQSIPLASTTAPKQPAASPIQSSTSTSPLSVSSTSSVSRIADNLESLVLNVNGAKAKGLEKSQKDLQRQIVSLNKLTSGFNDECDMSIQTLDTVFNTLKSSLEARRNALMQQLIQTKTIGQELLSQRQMSAIELRQKIENAESLSEQQLLDLKADIKHFVSERKVDEDLGQTKRFAYNDLDKLRELVDSFGQLSEIKNNYSLPKSPVSETGSVAIVTIELSKSKAQQSTNPVPSILPQPQLQQAQKQPQQAQKQPQQAQKQPQQAQKQPQQAQKQAQQMQHHSKVAVNGSYNDKRHNEVATKPDANGFVEVKRPQRNKNKNQVSDTNGYTNGATQQQQQSTNNYFEKLPKRQPKTPNVNNKTAPVASMSINGFNGSVNVPNGLIVA